MVCPKRCCCQRAGAAPAARVVGALLVGPIVLAIAACSGGAIAQNTPLSGSGYVSGNDSSHYYAPAARSAAPTVSGTTLTGQHLSLRQDRGSVIVLNFWGSWCPPCRREAPVLAALARRLAGHGVRFLGVDIRDSVPSAKVFERTFGVGYPSLNDPAGLIALAFGGTVPLNAFPSTLVIDRTGRIAASVFGEVSYSGLRALVGKILSEPS